MFEYELHQTRSAELIRKAENHRLAQEALRSRRAARRAAVRESGQQEENDTEGRSHTHRPRRHRFARVA
ncbi:hypothetical protein ACFVYF_35155 [Streptomyces sp. NPDC058274]|uniref:hypothetical protein n=1 Tax=Streptomyces sp. NPDC058274 TaxID=3346416 RepID=UPI0029D2EEE4|nr:hypothetical protein [Streptomyces sp.]